MNTQLVVIMAGAVTLLPVLAQKQPPQPNVQALTPILIVERIEPCLPFWDALGFKLLKSVPGKTGMQFAMLGDGSRTVMYQTIESVRGDLKITPAAGQSALYLAVADIDAATRGISPNAIVVQKRRTEYGMTEIFVREPGGNLVGFAQP